MAGTGNADRGSHHDLLFFLFVLAVQLGAGSVVHFSDTVVHVLRTRATVFSLRVEGAQGVGGSGLAAHGLFAVAVLLLVQFVVDIVGCLVVLFIRFVQVGTVQDLVCLLLKRLACAADLVGGTRHIRAHGGCQRLRGVFAVGGGSHRRAASDRSAALQFRFDSGVRQVDGHARADCRGFAYSEGTGCRLGDRVFFCGDAEVALFHFAAVLPARHLHR